MTRNIFLEGFFVSLITVGGIAYLFGNQILALLSGQG
jgi:hypothetical protein